MANAPVEFDQRKIFDQSNPLLKATLTNILSFSNDVAGGLGTLLEFLKVLKIFLQAIKDPIALILLPAIDQLIDAGFVDSFRLFDLSPNNYTWWNMRSRARDRNVGWRIDYFFVSKNLVSNINDSDILSDVMGSDHCPVKLDLSF